MCRPLVVIRVTHRVSARSLLVLLMSGLQILDAHPARHRGNVSTFDGPLLSPTSTEDVPPKGATTSRSRTGSDGNADGTRVAAFRRSATRRDAGKPGFRRLL